MRAIAFSDLAEKAGGGVDNTHIKGSRSIKVAYLSLEKPALACPTIRVHSPFRLLKDRITLYSPLEYKRGRYYINKKQLYMADVILVQRSVLFHDRVIEKLAGPHQKVVYETDDLLVNTPVTSYLFDDRERSAIVKLLRSADLVTVSTEELRRHLEIYNDNIHVIPNYIDPLIWCQAEQEKIKDPRIVIAFVGTPTHQKDLRVIIPAVRKIQKRYGNRIVFKFYGCITDELRRIPGAEFVSDLIRDYKEFARFLLKQKIDIALAPLLANTFNQCKSNIKFLEYSVCRIAGIYSRIKPYQDTVRDGYTGLLCDQNSESWYKAMRRLIEDPQLRKSIADNAHREVQSRWMLDRQKAEQWSGLIEGLAASGRISIKMERARKSGYSMKVSVDGKTCRALHSLYDPEAEASRIVENISIADNTMMVVLGLGLGYHIKQLIRQCPEARIVVVEASRDIFETAKEKGFLSEIEEKVEFIIGYPADDTISEITMLQIRSGMPAVKILSHPASVSVFREYYEKISQKLENARRVSLKDRLKYPKFKSEKMRVLVLDLGYFLRKEIVHAFQSLGHEVYAVTPFPKDSPGVIVREIINTVLENKPDFMFTVNHLGFDEEGILASFLASIDMPVVSWFVDSPELILKAPQRNTSSNMFLFVWDRLHASMLKSSSQSHVHYLPLGADTTVFRPVDLTRAQLKKWSGQITFVGSSMVNQVRQALAEIPEYLHGLVEKIAGMICKEKISLSHAEKFLNREELDLIKSLDEDGKIDFHTAILWEATRRYRSECMEALRDFHPVIYGDSGWRGLLDSDFQIVEKVNYYNDLPMIYNACKINFNATSLQMPEAVNQRVFDVPACRGFLITDHQSAVEELFEPGREVITYREVEEIPELVGFYLGNERARKEIAGRAHERVLKEHTYVHRVQRMIDILKEAFRN